MPKAVSYRILERQEEGRWEAFAVAYRRGDRFVLFAPPWRSSRDLPVRSLEELSREHYPAAGEYRWSTVQAHAGEIRHPIEILRSSPAAQPQTDPHLLDAISSVLAFADRSGQSGDGPEEPEPAPDPEDLARLAADDPEFGAAVLAMRAAVTDPRMRPIVLQALAAFARAAHPKKGR